MIMSNGQMIQMIISNGHVIISNGQMIISNGHMIISNGHMIISNGHMIVTRLPDYFFQGAIVKPKG